MPAVASSLDESAVFLVSDVLATSRSPELSSDDSSLDESDAASSDLSAEASSDTSVEALSDISEEATEDASLDISAALSSPIDLVVLPYS